MSLERKPSEEASAEADVLEVIRTMLAEVIGEEYIGEIEIGPETSFYGELEIESIEFVALAERLQERFGDRVDFSAWMATMEVDEIIAMTVGQLVDYIVAAVMIERQHG